MQERRLDTPEHAAYRAAILAFGEGDVEVKRLRAELIDLQREYQEVEEENVDLQRTVWRLESELENALVKRDAS